MGAPAVGEVVVVPFPFSDLTQSKVRPALCLTDAGRGDRVLCQITSQPYGDLLALKIDDQLRGRWSTRRKFCAFRKAVHCRRESHSFDRGQALACGVPTCAQQRCEPAACWTWLRPQLPFTSEVGMFRCDSRS